MIKVVAIDFDDTLCLTEESSFHMENYVAQSLGFAPMTRETHRTNWGHPLREAIMERFPGIDINAFMEKNAEVFADFVKRGAVDLITDINFEILDTLKASGMKLAIVTARELLEVEHLLHENHPLQRRIDVFYHKDNSQYPKPDPRVFDQLLRDFQVSPNEVVYIGDTINDAKCAKGAGLHFIALLESGIKTEENFKGIPVDFFAQKFPDILTFINNHLS